MALQIAIDTNQQFGRIPFNPRLQLDYNTFSELRQLLSNKAADSTLHSRFACFLAIHLPEVAANIDEEDFGVIHLEMSVLAKATNDAIARNDWATTNKHLAFISDMLATVGKELHDAIRVSYIKYLFYNESNIFHAEIPQQLLQHLTDIISKLEE